MSEISSTFKNLKNVGMLVPNVSLSNSPVWVLQKPDGSWMVTGDYHKFHQVVVPIAAAMPDIVLLLKQNYTASGMSRQALRWQMLSFPSLSKKRIRNSLCSFGTDNSIHLQSFPRAMLTLLLSVIMQSEETWTGWTSHRISQWSTVLMDHEPVTRPPCHAPLMHWYLSLSSHLWPHSGGWWWCSLWLTDRVGIRSSLVHRWIGLVCGCKSKMDGSCTTIRECPIRSVLENICERKSSQLAELQVVYLVIYSVWKEK